MNGKIWKILLAASLALNLALAVPYVYREFIAKPKHKPGKHSHEIDIAKEPGLRKEQKEQIDAIIKDFRFTMMNYKQEILEKRIHIIEELGNPEFDPETVTTYTDELNQLQNQLNLQFVDTLMRITTQLDPEQRLHFLYKLSRNWFYISGSSRRRKKE